MYKNRVPIVVGAVIVLILIMLAILFVQNGHMPEITNLTTNSTNTPILNSPRNSDASNLMDISPLPPDLPWSLAASTTSNNPPFSIDSYPSKVVLKGEAWITSSTEEGFLERVLKDYDDYYLGLIRDHGWQIQTYVGGHKLTGMAADGPNYGSDYGLIKIQNDYLRVILVEKGRRLGSAWFRIFVSDIVPIAQIIPSSTLPIASSTSSVSK